MVCVSGCISGGKNPPTVGDIVPWPGDFELSEREAITLSIRVYNITSLSFLPTVDAV